MIDCYESKVGHKYYPLDNSYSICLSGGLFAQIAGNKLQKPMLTTIRVDRFLINVRNSFNNEFVPRHVVIVDTEDGKTHMVLWDERGLDIEAIDKRWKHPMIMLDHMDLISKK